MAEGSRCTAVDKRAVVPSDRMKGSRGAHQSRPSGTSYALFLLVGTRPRGRCTSVPGGVELLAGRVRHAHVVDDDGGAGHSLRAVADDDVLDDQVVGNREVGEVDLGTIQLHGRVPVRRY